MHGVETHERAVRPPTGEQILEPAIDHRRIAEHGDGLLEQLVDRLVGPRADEFGRDFPQQRLGIERERVVNADRPVVGIGISTAAGKPV